MNAGNLFSLTLILCLALPGIGRAQPQPALPRRLMFDSPSSGNLLPQQGNLLEHFVYPNGGFLTLGVAQVNREERGFVTRRFADGRLDTGFGTQGIASLPGEHGSRPLHMRVDARGRILVIGMEFPSRMERGMGRNRAVLYRLNPDGTPDLTWGEAGTLLLPGVASERHWVSIMDFTLLPGNWLAIAFVHLQGRSPVRGGQDIHRAAILVINEEGEPHPSFGEEGLAIPETADPLHFSALRILRSERQGDFIVYGSAQFAQGRYPMNRLHAFLGRITAQGTWDTRVGDGKGYILRMMGEGFPQTDANQSILTHALELPDGRIAAAGYWLSSGLNRKFDSFVAVFQSDGTPDPRFGERNTGISVLPRTTQPDWAFWLNRLPNGDFLVAGTNARGGYLQRISSDGQRSLWQVEGLSTNTIEFRAAMHPNGNSILTGGQAADPVSLVWQQHDTQGRPLPRWSPAAENGRLRAFLATMPED